VNTSAHGDLSLQEPPALPETSGRDFLSALMMLPTMLGSGVFMLIYIAPSNPALGLGLLGHRSATESAQRRVVPVVLPRVQQ
jgi:hypothetical protein